jgi:hypothetical protein
VHSVTVIPSLPGLFATGNSGGRLSLWDTAGRRRNTIDAHAGPGMLMLWDRTCSVTQWASPVCVCANGS